MKLLLTGGLGFIGSHVVEVFKELENVEIFVFDNGSTGNNYFVKDFENVTLIMGDITNKNDYCQLPKDITHCIHLAAAISVAESMINPEKYELNNVIGSQYLLDWFKEQKDENENYYLQKICVASSAAVYGNPKVAKLPETEATGGLSPYATTKFEMESLLKSFQHETGIECISFRFFNVFGPRQDPSSQYSGVMSIFMDRIKNNKGLVVFGDGLQTRDFIYVRDIVNGFKTFFETKIDHYFSANLGTSKAISLLDLIDCLFKITGKTVDVSFKDAREGDIVHSCSSIDTAVCKLNWTPNFSLEEGLNDTWNWFLNN
eukprot:TRINITY_DN3030_c4_g4_i1.p1 TRINITY_DN3030_c4_g4~~TRINITY_DN3030_c4_g4_i1.p1  ORF type:complete len:317 (-),score=82.66 TRINITY_DN3030_c4_g4_i1:599-1549(-)